MKRGKMNHRGTEAQSDALSGEVIGAAIEVHRALGSGLLESAYENCLVHEHKLRGRSFSRQVELPIHDKGLRLEEAYRLNILVERRLIVEIKTVDALAPIHEAQLLTYLRMSGIHTGLLINFNVPILKQGLKRMVL